MPYKLPRVVVKPKQAQGEIVCDYFEGNEVLGVQNRRRIAYDLVTGLICVCKNQIQLNIFPTIRSKEHIHGKNGKRPFQLRKQKRKGVQFQTMATILCYQV